MAFAVLRSPKARLSFLQVKSFKCSWRTLQVGIDWNELCISSHRSLLHVSWWYISDLGLEIMGKFQVIFRSDIFFLSFHDSLKRLSYGLHSYFPSASLVNCELFICSEGPSTSYTHPGSSGARNIMFNTMLSLMALVHSHEFLWAMCRPRRRQLWRLRYLSALSLLLCRVRNIQHSLMHNIAV